MATNEDIISVFNSHNLKNIHKLKDMIVNKAYLIDGAYRTTTKYGDSVVLQLEDGLLYLPKRYNLLGNDVLDKITDGAFTISKVLLHEDKNDSAFKLELNEHFNSNTFFGSY